jgi:hypothetical protein
MVALSSHEASFSYTPASTPEVYHAGSSGLMPGAAR